MGLGTVLNNSISGLRVTQSAIDVVSQNIANADTPGYVRRSLSQIDDVSGDRTVGVRALGTQRMLDILVQRQARVELSGAGYTDVVSRFQSALDQLFGPPGGPSALDTRFNAFTQSVQKLTTNPADYALRSNLVENAQTLTSVLNGLTQDVQAMRQDAERSIATAVGRANILIDQITVVNAKIVGNGQQIAPPALLDERDRAISELAKLMDIRVEESTTRGVTIFTNSGIQLFDGARALKLQFDARDNIGAQSLYSSNAAASGVGTIRLVDGAGGFTDLVAMKGFRSGEIAGLLSLRDQTLVEAQNQLDGIAAGLASALSDRQAPTTAVTVGPQTGFDIDLTSLPLPGNAMTFSYTDTGGVSRTVKVVRYDGVPQPLPVNDGSADQVIGLDFSGGAAGLVGPLNAAFGPALAFSNTGATLRVLDTGTNRMRSADARITNTALTGQGPELPLFTDIAGVAYTGSLDSGTAQARGFAGRISVNPGVLADRSKLVVFQTAPTTTPQGDATRPTLLLDRLTNATMRFSSATGIGGQGGYVDNLASFTRRVVEQRGAAAEGARQLDEGQQVVLNAVEARLDEQSGVNLDREMANLTTLQNAYAANARVISAVREMLDVLMRL
jgi:flagellar hook-associated protein 1